MSEMIEIKAEDLDRLADLPCYLLTARMIDGSARYFQCGQIVQFDGVPQPQHAADQSGRRAPRGRAAREPAVTSAGAAVSFEFWAMRFRFAN
jgi:hypothetical protein